MRARSASSSDCLARRASWRERQWFWNTASPARPMTRAIALICMKNSHQPASTRPMLRSTDQARPPTSQVESISSAKASRAIHCGGTRASGRRSRYNAPTTSSTIHCTSSEVSPK